MALPFTSNPEKVARRDLDAACTSRDAVAKRLAAAQAKVTECEATLARLAREGAQDPALLNGEIALDEAERRVSTLQPALAEAEKLVALLESQLAETIDKKARAATAAECEALADDLEAVGKEIVLLMTGLATVAERATKFTLDGRGLASYADLSRTQVPDAVTMICSMLRGHAVGLTAAPVVAPPPNVKLFALRPVKWRDETGRQCVGRRFTDIDLPAGALVARALRSGVCCQLNDPLRKKHFGAEVVGSPAVADCFDLNSGAGKPERAAPEAAPIQHSAFETPTIGTPFTVQTARNGL